ncbi:MAG: 5-oxoprolinase subunit PxpA [Litorimonas sp.]
MASPIMTDRHIIDLNADIGEADTADWAWAEAQIVMAISSANIACGGHAGDNETMRATVQACKARGVVIGAHPAYPDRENFGRKSLILGQDISAAQLTRSLTAQIVTLTEIAADQDMTVSYVKPHGALYNDAVTDIEKARLITQVIGYIDPKLILLGGPNSCMQIAAQDAGLTFIAEGFIDRRYTDEGHLQPRGKDGAVIKDTQMRLTQACSLAQKGEVQTASGNILTIQARSLCLHGDSAGAVETAWQARKAIENLGIKIQAFAA